MIQEKKHVGAYSAITIGIVALFSFWHLGGNGIHSWDEALYGINAMEMLKTGDPINYYSMGEVDKWSAKPPLMVWAIVTSYKIFGFTEFALRFPSALSICFFFFFFYKITRLYISQGWSLMAVLILVGSKGIIGVHVARTGDSDAMFMLWLFATIYLALSAIELDKWKRFVPAGIMLGLAFYTKSFAAILYIFPLIVYLMYKCRKKLFTNKFVWIGIFCFIFISSSWILLLAIFGNTWEHSTYNTHNALETMFKYDILGRATNPNFVVANPYQLDFVPIVLDTKLFVWAYVFYTAAVCFVIALIFQRSKPSLGKNKSLLIISILFILLLSLVFTFMRNKNGWYYSPVLPFVIVFTILQLKKISSNRKWIAFPFYGLTTFSLVWHFMYIHQVNDRQKIWFSSQQPLFEQCEIINVHTLGMEPADLLYAYWSHPRVIFQTVKPYDGLSDCALYMEEGVLKFEN